MSRIGPAVRFYLQRYGLEASKVKATGPRGTVLKGDVLKYVLANNLEPVVTSEQHRSTSTPPAKPPSSFKPKGKIIGPASFVDKEISNMRRTIAKRLVQSKSTIPHSYGIAHCSMEKLIALRKSLMAAGVKVSVNDILIKCVANALTLYPVINCVWQDSQLKRLSQVDISVAVATPNGLITPIIHNAAGINVVAIAALVRILATKARDGKLQPHEFMGGTFSISNLGMFGIHSFSAIINPPQCAILAVGGSLEELNEDGKSLSVAKVMLSYDARAIMEDDAAKFLSVLRNEIDNVNETSMGIFNIEDRKDELVERGTYGSTVSIHAARISNTGHRETSQYIIPQGHT